MPLNLTFLKPAQPAPVQSIAPEPVIPDPTDTVALAKALYGPPQWAPPWEQLSDVTQGVWIEKAVLKQKGVEDWWSCKQIG